MSGRQVAHLREMRGLWAKHAPALRTKAQLDGGMTWKRVGRGEYLCRYRQDPLTGQKRFTSLGPRSTDAEETYRRFIEERASARTTLAETSNELALVGRLAKTLGLARMPIKNAEAIRAFWLASLFDQWLLVLGGSALFAYELDAAVLTPPTLVQEDALTFLLRDGVELDEAVDDIIAAYADASGTANQKVRETDYGVRLTAPDFPPVAVMRARWFLDRLDGDGEWERQRSGLQAEQVDVLQAAFALPPVVGIAVARDSKPVEIKAPDPRAYALLEHVAAGDETEPTEEPASVGRAEFAAATVRERWPEKFDEHQEEAFGPFCRGEEADDGGFALRGP
jgi:Nucleotidyltransferase